MKLADMPLLYDDWISCVVELEALGKWDMAAKMWRYIASVFKNPTYVARREANALYHFGDYRGALDVLKTIDDTVSVLLIKARCQVKLDNRQIACKLYEKALLILER